MYKLFGVNALTSIISIFISLSFTLFASRYFSIEDFGSIRYVMTLIPLLVVFGFPGFDRVVLKSGFDKRIVNLFDILKIKFCCSLFFCVCIYTLIEIELFFDKSYSNVLKHVILILPLYELFSSYKNYLIGRGFPEKAAYIYLISRFSSAVLFTISLVNIVFFDLDYAYLLFLYLLSFIIPQTFSYFRVIKLKVGLKYFTKMPSKSLFLSGISSTTAGALTTLAFSLDKLMVFELMGAKYLALYSILIMFPQEISRLIDSFIPYIYRKIDNFDLNKISKIRCLGFVFFVFFVLFIPIYSFIFKTSSAFIFGNEFSYSNSEVILSAILIFSLSLEFFFTQKLYLTKGGSSLLYSSGVNNILTFLLIYLLGEQHGLTGFLAAIIIKNSFVCIFSKFMLSKNVY